MVEAPIPPGILLISLRPEHATEKLFEIIRTTISYKCSSKPNPRRSVKHFGKLYLIPNFFPKVSSVQTIFVKAFFRPERFDVVMVIIPFSYTSKYIFKSARADLRECWRTILVYTSDDFFRVRNSIFHNKIYLINWTQPYIEQMQTMVNSLFPHRPLCQYCGTSIISYYNTYFTNRDSKTSKRTTTFSLKSFTDEYKPYQKRKRCDLVGKLVPSFTFSSTIEQCV